MSPTEGTAGGTPRGHTPYCLFSGTQLLEHCPTHAAHPPLHHLHLHPTLMPSPFISNALPLLPSPPSSLSPSLHVCPAHTLHLLHFHPCLCCFVIHPAIHHYTLLIYYFHLLHFYLHLFLPPVLPPPVVLHSPPHYLPLPYSSY